MSPMTHVYTSSPPFFGTNFLPLFSGAAGPQNRGDHPSCVCVFFWYTSERVENSGGVWRLRFAIPKTSEFSGRWWRNAEVSWDGKKIKKIIGNSNSLFIISSGSLGFCPCSLTLTSRPKKPCWAQTLVEAPLGGVGHFIEAMTHLTIARLTDTWTFFVWTSFLDFIYCDVFFCWAAKAKWLIRITTERCQLELEG